MCAGTSLAEDQQRLSSPDARKLPKEEALALQFRVEKKGVLHACLASLGAAPPPA